MSNISPAVVSTSNLLYLGDSLVHWEHVVQAVFQSFTTGSLSNFNKLKSEFLSKLQSIKTEFDAKEKFYTDVLPVTFESKVRLVLSILKVNLFDRNLNRIKHLLEKF